MGLDSLLATMETRNVTPVTPIEAAGVTLEPSWIKACTLVTSVTPQNNVTANEPANDWKFTSDGEPEALLLMADDHEFDEEARHLVWVFHFAEDEPETGVFMKPVNYRQALAMYPQAIAAVPFTITVEASCETCQNRTRPGGYPSPFLCGGRADLPPAYGDGHPLRQLPENGGTDCEHALLGAVWGGA